MKSKLKLLLYTLILLFSIPIGTFHFIAKYTLPYHVIKTRKTAVTESVPRIIFEFHPKLWRWQKERIRAVLEKNCEIAIPFEEANNIDRRDSNTQETEITIHYKLMDFKATVIEGNGYFSPESSAVYVEIWESEYQWGFSGWSKLTHKCTGQS